ncbi:MAG: hypothetical protein ACPGYX_04025, partial [Oceanobacter sp.]
MKEIFQITHSRRDWLFIAVITFLIGVAIATDLSPMGVLLRLVTWALVIGITVSLLVFTVGILINVCGRLLR